MNEPDLTTLRRHFEALPPEHFAPLRALLPTLRGRVPRMTSPLKEGPEGVLQLSFHNPRSIDQLIAVCHELGMVLPFDWSAFMNEHPYAQWPALIDGFDRFQCAQALTALIRGDRFSHGVLHTAWRNGILVKLVQRVTG